MAERLPDFDPSTIARQEAYWARQRQEVFESLKTAHAKSWNRSPSSKHGDAWTRYCRWKREWWLMLEKNMPVEFRKSQSFILPDPK
jgi:hypothetical protein